MLSSDLTMTDLAIDVLVPLILAPLIISPLLAVYYYQYRKYQRHTPYLLLEFLTMFLASVFAGASFLFDENPFQGGPVSLTAELAVFLMPFFFYMHYQSLVSVRPPLKRFAVFLVITVFPIALHVPEYFGLLDRTDPGFSIYYLSIAILQLVQATLLYSYCVKIAYRNYTINRSSTTRLELLAIFFLLIGFVGIAFEFIFEYGGVKSDIMLFLISTIPSLLGLAGFLLFLINYFRNPDYLYSVPVEIHSIVFYNPVGIPLYKKRFESETRVSETLFTGAFTAIAAVLKEAINENVQLRHINLGLHNVFFGHVKELGTLALICDEGSSFFITSIDRFIASLPERLHALLSNASKITKITIELTSEMDKHLLTMFPFLKIKD
jgi:hypothetical protein